MYLNTPKTPKEAVEVGAFVYEGLQAKFLHNEVMPARARDLVIDNGLCITPCA
jgi:hypothetical protein